ncbi:MAG: HEAT repeat domain-containing protein, partial [Myxococcales bacterium]|nr:HEAT repeat domain-containing protein [Myxococcales bacterium]
AFGAASWELVRALDDADDRVVLAAIDALSWSDDPHVADALARKLDDPDPEIARAAADALAARPDAR